MGINFYGIILASLRRKNTHAFGLWGELVAYSGPGEAGENNEGTFHET